MINKFSNLKKNNKMIRFKKQKKDKLSEPQSELLSLIKTIYNKDKVYNNEFTLFLLNQLKYYYTKVGVLSVYDGKDKNELILDLVFRNMFDIYMTIRPTINNKDLLSLIYDGTHNQTNTSEEEMIIWLFFNIINIQNSK